MKNQDESLNIDQLIEDLGSKDGMKRKKAREILVTKGNQAVDALTKLVDHRERIIRWEALKSLEEIGNPVSIPVFIQALDDDHSDIRWLAAEGLIKGKNKSLKPLLELILEKSDSVFVLAGAHHIIHKLHSEKLLPEGFPTKKMLSVLKNPGWEESLKVTVHQTLKELKNTN